jgi:hypothetical protein
MSTRVAIAIAISSLLIAVILYVMYGGSKPACILDTDCTAPQTCVSGVCTDPVACTPACVLPQSCVAGTCKIPTYTYAKEVNRSGNPGCAIPADTTVPSFNWSVTSGAPNGPTMIAKCTSTPSCIGYYSGTPPIPWLIGTNTDPASCTSPLDATGYKEFYRKVAS